MTNVPVQLGILAVSVLGLWIGARLLVDSVIRLARRVGLSELTIGLTVVAAGTSTPELVVTAGAAMNGLGPIAVGNVVGSNVYNLAFILGVVAVIRFLPVERTLLRRDGVVLVASTLLGAFVLFDLRVSRLEGVLLVGSFLAYTTYLLWTGRSSESSDPPSADAAASEPDTAPAANGEAESGGRDGRSMTDRNDTRTRTRGGIAVPATTAVTERVSFRGRDVLLLVVGLAIVLFSGDTLVTTASALARGAGVSESVIGGTIVAAGTSTPEFAVSLVAIQQNRLGVSIGNVVGSNIFNLLGVLGVGAVVRPLEFGGQLLETVAWLVVLTLVMAAALWTGRRLSRAEGALFTLSEIARWVLGLLGRFG